MRGVRFYERTKRAMAGEVGAGRETGTIVAWGEWDNFGFARRDTNQRGKQVFVHADAAGRRLQPGTRISFTVEHTPRGLRAFDVVVEDPSARRDEGSAR